MFRALVIDHLRRVFDNMTLSLYDKAAMLFAEFAG